MKIQNRHLTRALMLTAFTAAGIAGAAAYDAATHAAQADTKPGIVAEQGGRLGHNLPPRTADQAREALDQVLPDRPQRDEPATRTDLIGQLIDSFTAPATQPPPRAKPTPTPDATGCDGTATTSNTSCNGQFYADVTTEPTPAPTLDRLHHIRARSALPASRHVAIEPGPA